jgi:hypothetical protein
MCHNKVFFWVEFSQVFCHSNRKLTKQAFADPSNNRTASLHTILSSEFQTTTLQLILSNGKLMISFISEVVIHLLI